jgi:hypothetical protein
MVIAVLLMLEHRRILIATRMLINLVFLAVSRACCATDGEWLPAIDFTTLTIHRMTKSDVECDLGYAWNQERQHGHVFVFWCNKWMMATPTTSTCQLRARALKISDLGESFFLQDICNLPVDFVVISSEL